MDFKLCSKVLWLFTILLIIKQCNCQNVTEFCTNSVQTISYRIGSSINITSPDYPSSSYSISHDCEINIDTGSTERVGFRIVQRNLGNESSKCRIDYLILDSSGAKIPIKQNCSLANDNDAFIDGHHTSSQTGFKLKLPAGSTLGFILTFTALPLYSMTSSTQTVSAVTSPSGYIMSHVRFDIQYAKNYYNNRHNRLNLADIRGVTELHVEFIFMAIGPSTKCESSGDLFRLSSKPTDDLYSCGGIRIPSPPQYLPINPDTSSLLFSLTTDSGNRYPGFLLKYTTFTNSSTTSTPTSTTTSTTSSTVSTTTSTGTTTSTSTITSTSRTINTTKSTTASALTSTNTIVIMNTSKNTTNRTNIDPDQSAITRNVSNNALAKTSTEPEAEEAPNALKQFFENQTNIIAVAAGGGGLILMVVIIVLACLLCRKFRRSRNTDDSIRDKDIASDLAPHTPNRTTGKFYNKGIGYSSVELAPTQHSEENVRVDDVDLHYSAVKPGEAPATDVTETVVDEARVEGAANKVEEEKGGEVVYAVVNKPRVEMFDNDLYASKDSLSSSGEVD